jgi:hypothetical protein
VVSTRHTTARGSDDGAKNVARARERERERETGATARAIVERRARRRTREDFITTH